MLTVSETSLEIADRFFQAIDVLIQSGELRGLQSFAKRHRLNSGNFNTLKNNRGKRAVKTEYLAYLAEDFNVSCEWLLLGKGPMFNGSST